MLQADVASIPIADYSFAYLDRMCDHNIVEDRADSLLLSQILLVVFAVLVFVESSDCDPRM